VDLYFCPYSLLSAPDGLYAPPSLQLQDSYCDDEKEPTSGLDGLSIPKSQIALFFRS